MPPESEHFAEGAQVEVLTVQPVGRPLDYAAPAGGCRTGAFVEVPLGARSALGVVWGPGRCDVPPERLRPVARMLDAAPMRAEMRAFLERAGAYTMTPMPAMLRLATRAPGLGDPPPALRAYRAGGQAPERMTPARRRVLDALKEHGGAPLPIGDLCALAGVSPSVVAGLAAQGALAEESLVRERPLAPLDPERGGVGLNEEQAAAAAALIEGLRMGGFGATLLRGVTGSGKSEVYLEAVAEALRLGRQALVMLPEIALTGEFIARVEARFGAPPALWHSAVAAGERRRIWRMAGQGECPLVVGTRSALFLPFASLGLIVVDEEHDSSYKQEEGALYNARDMAVLRASLCGARVVLASATPSLESWVNAESGKYARLDLTARYGAAQLPQTLAVDMRAEGEEASGWISPSLREAVRGAIGRGEQALLFLNRRGYAPVTLCRVCGEQIGCGRCDARMTEHRLGERLLCHCCGDSRRRPEACPSCGAEGQLVAVGPGVERVAEEAAEVFAGARIATLSSDTGGTAQQMRARLREIAEGGADVIVGTQIVAKGHNFPLLSVVGVIDADLGLQGADLRAAERTFQQMTQVSGRAGRADTGGLALLQTHQPGHPVIEAILSGDEEGFRAAEAAQRRLAQAPPYGRMAGIILSARDSREANRLGAQLAAQDESLRRVGAQVFGPAPAPISRIRGMHRVRLLVKAPKGAALQEAIARWTLPARDARKVRLTVDIDPQSFM